MNQFVFITGAAIALTHLFFSKLQLEASFMRSEDISLMLLTAAIIGGFAALCLHNSLLIALFLLIG